MMSAEPKRRVDYHCHLDLYQDYERQFAQCGASSVEILAVTTTPRAWSRNRALSASFSNIRVALGLHPQLVAQTPNELRIFESHLPEARFVGEVGLDASPRYYASFAEQRRIFQHILNLCAAAGNKILSIHSVRAGREVLNCIEQSLAGSKSRAVLHWFTGSKEDAKRAAELGCFFSMNSQMFDTPTAHRILDVIPENRLLTETDGPFVQIGDRAIHPGEVDDAVTRLARALNYSEVQMENLILSNLAILEKETACES